MDVNRMRPKYNTPTKEREDQVNCDDPSERDASALSRTGSEAGSYPLAACTKWTLVRLLNFSQLFFDLNSNSFPSFDQLKLSAESSSDSLPPEAKEIIERQLAPVYQICRHFGFRPLASEFSLITDTRLLASKEYFSSYLSFFIASAPLAQRMADAYADAIRYMATPAAGKTQIVPHPELFGPETALIRVDCKDLFPEIPGASTSDQCDVEKPVYTTALRQRFELIGGPDRRDLKQQVEAFLRKLFENMANSNDLAPAAQRLVNSHFLLLPFVRPNFESAALPLTGTSKDKLRGYPGGALFLFLEKMSHGDSVNDVTQEPTKEEEEGQDPLNDIARALSWLLAEASLRESYRSQEVRESQNRYFATYSLTHPLKHRLGSLYSDAQGLRRSYDRQGSDFPERLALHEKLVQSVHWFAQLAHTIHYAAVHGPEKTLCAEDENKKLKFGGKGPLNLLPVFAQIASDQVFIGAFDKIPQLNYSEGFSPTVDGFLAVEEGNDQVRLSDDLYRELVYEVVANALIHGAGEDIVHVEMHREEVHGVPALVITNEVREAAVRKHLGDAVPGWKEWDASSPTGLSFIRDLLKRTRSGALYYKHPIERAGMRKFSVALALSGLTKED